MSMEMEFAFAGSHTNSQTLAWCVYEVGRSRTVADGLVAELRRQVWDGAGQQMLTQEQVRRLRYARFKHVTP